MNRTDLKIKRRSPWSLAWATMATTVLGCLAILMATLSGCTKEDDDISGDESVGGTWTGVYSGVTFTLEIDADAGTYLMSAEGASETGTFNPKTYKMVNSDGEAYTVKYHKEDDTLTLTDDTGITIVFHRAGSKEEPDEPDEPEAPDVKVVMQNVTFRGVVKDAEGALLSDVQVATGSEAATTDNQGVFTFTKVGVVGNRTVMKFTKDGYFPITRSGVKADEMNMEVVMQLKGNSGNTSQATFSAGTAKTLSAGNMKVSIPASSLVKADGSAYTGSVKADMFYLDPNNSNMPQLMPGGDLAAVRSNNSQVQLITYGMVEVSLIDANGNPLQLKKGAESEMTFPIPAGMDKNPPAILPLWYFDEARGIWVEEGTATLKSNMYVGKVTHFSWHNLDLPEDRVTIKGKVTDCKGQPVKYVQVTVDQTSAVTSSAGDYQVYVPANTPVTVTVRSEDYFGYTPVVSYNVPGQPGNTTVTQNVSLPCVVDIAVTIKGKVTDCKSRPLQYVTVWVGQVTALTNASGDYSVIVPANKPVTVTVKSEDYGNYSPVVSHNVPGQRAGSTYTRNISLPCSTVEPEPDEPEEIPEGGFYAAKSGRIRFLARIDDDYAASGYTTYYSTIIFDDYGKRQRHETEIDGETSIIIIDYITKKYYAYAGGQWIDMTQYIPFEQMDFSSSDQYSYQQYMNDYKPTITTETIAGKSCTVYTLRGKTPVEGCDLLRTGTWKGLPMLVETCGLLMVAQEASLEIPANSFTPN